ncbi:MAG: tetratricopeptide repeat protein [Candidatus Omnitrophica bacterium]|nr:tetratricopeptide repeat protein [Candidatus Omnitrophota bacterium]
MKSKRNKGSAVLAAAALIIILGFAAYANSVGGRFVDDDDVLIRDNAFIKSRPGLANIFKADIGTGAGSRYSFYRPIQMLTYALDYRIWKLNVVGYHLTGILLHVITALCVYWLTAILFGDKMMSVLVALFFVVHPVHTVVVNYISTRAEILYLLFFLIAFIFYIKSLHADNITPYLVIISSYALALLSKENSLILPALLLLYHYTFKKKIGRRGFLPIVVLALIYIFLRMTVLKFLITGVVYKGTLIQRIPGFFVALATYVRLLFLPFSLHIEYGKGLFNFADPRALSGLAVLICLIFLIFKMRKSNKLVFFSMSWFLITLLPVSNLYPLNAYMSENWLYLPSIGFFMMLAGFLSSLYKRGKFRILIIGVSTSLLIFYSYLTIRQNQTWRDPITFYERALKYAPDSARIHNNLGAVYYSMGEKEKAIPLYRKTIELDPSAVNAYVNLGASYYETGKKEEAMAMYKKAIELDPTVAGAYNNLGASYYETGKKEEAAAMYRKAIELNPNYATAYFNLAIILYCDMGNKEEAVASLKKVIELEPNYAEAYNNLGVIYDSMGKKQEAFSLYKKAVEINPGYASAWNNLGGVCYDGKQYDMAIEYYDRAIALGGNVNADIMKSLEPFRAQRR